MSIPARDDDAAASSGEAHRRAAHGYEARRDAAMAAFTKSWRRELMATARTAVIRRDRDNANGRSSMIVANVVAHV
jgi:hypothetical protein